MHRFVIMVAGILVTLAFSASRWPAGGWRDIEMAQGCDPDTTSPVIVYPSQDIAVQLGSCDGSQTAVVFFDVTATDACDPAPALSIDVSASPGGDIQLQNPFRNTFLALAIPGTYQLELTATDASGNSRVEDFSIVVTQPPAPVPNVACNGTVVVNLGSGCQRYISADMLLEGDMGCLRDADFRIEIQDADPSNGNILDEVGVYPYSIEPIQPLNAAGFAGPFALSRWGVHVDFQGGVASSVAADSLLLTGSNAPAFAIAVLPIRFGGTLSFRWGTASLPAGGTFEGSLLNPSGNVAASFSSADGASGMENLFVSAGDRLVLQLRSSGQGGSGPAPAAWLTNWVFDYAPVSITGLPSCWGEIEARDAGPVLDCPDDAARLPLATEVQQLQGELEVTGPVLNPALYSCLAGNNPPGGDHFYELIPFTVTQADVYTFFLDPGFNDGGALMALYQGTFDLANPCSNIIARADTPLAPGPIAGSGPFLRIGLPLRPGQQYYLLTTSDTPNAIGPYTYTVLSDGDGQVQGVPASSIDISYPLFCEDVPLVLDDPESLSLLGLPEVEGGCTDYTLSFDDALTQQGDCGPLFITRTFTATDQQGLTGTCDQRINFRRPTLEDVVLPPATTPIECDESFPVDGLGNPSPDFTGYPFLVTAGGIVDLRDAYCNIGASYDDGALVEVCLLSYVFVRTWTIIDWCDPDNPLEFNQVIKIGDFTAPEVNCPVVDLNGDGFPDPLVFSTRPFGCTATFSAPLPQVSDNCSLWEVTTEVVADEVTVIYGPSGNPVDTVIGEVVLATILPNAPNRIVSDIPVGCHRFRYTVEDECGNETVTECSFCVEDRVSPAAACDDTLNISIGPNGVARLFATSFEEGSYDNCGIDSFLIRREVRQEADCSPVAPFFTPWSEYVDFSCCEVNSTVRVELRVVDEAGNEDFCWMDALIEDKTRPRCTPPAAVSMPCDAVPAGFDPADTEQLQNLFGVPAVTDNCEATWNELPPANNLDDCGFGTFVRRFQAVDVYGNVSNTSCQQVVTLEERHNYEIRFPADGEANCGYPNPLDTIEVSETGCDLLAVSVEDAVLSASGDECYKLFRTYRVINWCEYDGESSPVVIGRDEDCDGAPGDEAVWVLRRPDRTYIDRDNDEGNANPQAGERGGNCPPENPEGYWRTEFSNGYWQYSQTLKAYDTIAPQILFVVPLPFCAISDDCLAEVEYLFTISDFCTPNDLEFEIYYDEGADGDPDSMVTSIFGVYPKWKINGEYPIGTHSFEVIVRDGCGNASAATLPFEVVDCKAPSPACTNGLVTSLMPAPPNTDADGDGDIDLAVRTIFATDFISSPTYDCSEPVKYSINRSGEMPSPDKNGLVLTCDDLGILIVEIHAWDAANNPYAVLPDDIDIRGPNNDYCETFILVQDNGGHCMSTQAMIAGLVEREDDEPVAEVDVALSGDGAGNVLTADDGLYVFPDLQLDYDYTITPFRDGDDQNGLSTFDIVLISQHILGTRPLDSPYKIIAADVNGSGSVSTIDIIQLRQVILSIILEFPDNTSWRFVPRDYTFPVPGNPWSEPFPEAISINNLNGQRLREDFVAIKIGDVDLSARANGQQRAEGRRHGVFLGLEGTDAHLQPGDPHVLTLRADMAGILGMQAALWFDTGVLEVEQVTGEAIGDPFLNRKYLEEGRLLLSWNTSVPIHAHAPLMAIRLRARKGCLLSEAIRLDDGLLAAEAYDENNQKQGLSLEWAPEQPVGALMQNFPNPFCTRTTIRFEAAEAGRGRLELFRLDGALVKAVEAFYPEGLHELEVQADELPGPGVYLYRLQLGQQSWVRKMMFGGR